jgi:rubrerythrin
MPNFASPFSEPLNGRKLTAEELIRAIRFVIAAEYEAAQMYMQIVEATDNELVRKVLTSVTDEERVHAGEFLKILHELAPDETEHYKEGEKEVRKEIKKDEKSVSESTETKPIRVSITENPDDVSGSILVIYNGKTHSANWQQDETLNRVVGDEYLLKAAMTAWEGANEFSLTERELEQRGGGWWSPAPVSESVKNILRMIDEKTITADDFNRFIAETSPTSINKRVQRQLRPKKVEPRISSPGRKVDDKTDHEPADHNDPTTTSRGRRSLQKQIKHNKAHPEQFREAIEFLCNNNGKLLSECKDALNGMTDLGSLCRIATRLSQRPNQYDSEWLLNLIKHLRGN